MIFRWLVGGMLCGLVVLQAHPSFGQGADPTGGKRNLVLDTVESGAFPSMVARIAISDENGAPLTNLHSTDLSLQEISGIDSKESFVNPDTISVNPDSHHPFRAVVILDVVVDPATMQNMVSGLKGLVDQINENDGDSILIFPVEHQKSRPALTDAFSSDKDLLKGALDGLQPVIGSETDLVEGISSRIQNFTGASVARQALIVLTDYGGNVKRDKIDPLIQAANEKRIPIHVIGYKLQQAAAANQSDALRNLAEKTGGTFDDQEDPILAAQSLKDIAHNLKHQYVFSYTTKLNVSQRDHRLRICIKGTPTSNECSQDMPYKAPPKPFNISLNLPGEAGSGNVPLRVDIGQHLPSVERVDYVISDNKSKVITLEGKAPSFEAVWDTSVIAPGSYSVYARAVDAIGNAGEVTMTMMITRSTPQATVLAPSVPATRQTSVSPLIVFQVLASFLWLALAGFALSRILILARQTIQSHYNLQIRNTGNAASQYTLRAFDQDDALWMTYSHEGLPLEMSTRVGARSPHSAQTQSGQSSALSASPAAVQVSNENIYRTSDLAMRIANALTMLSAFLPMANGTGLFGLANRIRQGRRWAQVGGNPISYVDPDQAYQKSSPQSIRNPPDSQAIAQAWVKTSAIDPGQEFDIKMTVQALTKHQDQYTVVIESFSLDDPSMSVNHIERRLSVGNTSPVRRWLPLLLAVGVIGLALAGLAWLIYL